MTRSRRLAYFGYLGCSFSVGVYSAFSNFTLSLWLAGFTSSYLLLGLLGNTKSFEGALVSPLFGALSDRTWLGWLGRRRPFILVGSLTAAVLLALTPHIGRLPLPFAFDWLPQEVAALAPAIVAIFLFTLAFNTMDDIHKALLPDLVAGAARNRLAALSVVVDMGGQVGLLVLGFFVWSQGVPDSAFALTGLLVAAGALITVVLVPEPAPAAWRAGSEAELPDLAAPSEQTGSPTAPVAALAASRAPHRTSDTRGVVALLLTRYRGAVYLCLVVFFYWSGVNAVMPLVSVYTRDILGATVGEAQLLPALLLLSTTLMAIPIGYFATRFGKRRTIAAGYAIMGCAALAGLVITTREQGAVVFLLAGIGNAAGMVLTIPLLADLVPRHHMGKATGALAASGSIAAPLASLAAGALSDTFGPRAIFGLMAGMVCAALVILPLIRTPSEVGAPHLTPALA